MNIAIAEEGWRIPEEQDRTTLLILERGSPILWGAPMNLTISAISNVVARVCMVGVETRPSDSGGGGGGGRVDANTDGCEFRHYK